MIACNATPLIYLARAGKLDLLKPLGPIYIPGEVKKEVVDEGKRLAKQDAWVVEKAINDGWIVVKGAKPLSLAIKLEAGEAAAISLAKELRLPLLIDEAAGRAAAKLAGVDVKGTLFVLLKAMETQLLTLPEFLETLDSMVTGGFRLRQELYVHAVKHAVEIAEKMGKTPRRRRPVKSMNGRFKDLPEFKREEEWERDNQ